jgi:transcriptional regulator of acetoin/glycerol metabolism
VRELKHAIEHASILCKGAIIRLSDLPLKIREYKPTFLPFPGGITRDEAAIILQTLQDARWNKTEAARTLGMSRQTLHRKLKSLDAGNSTR